MSVKLIVIKKSGAVINDVIALALELKYAKYYSNGAWFYFQGKTGARDPEEVCSMLKTKFGKDIEIYAANTKEITK